MPTQSTAPQHDRLTAAKQYHAADCERIDDLLGRWHGPIAQWAIERPAWQSILNVQIDSGSP